MRDLEGFGTAQCALLRCWREYCDWFQNSESRQTALGDEVGGKNGKRMKVDPRPTAELFLCR